MFWNWGSEYVRRISCAFSWPSKNFRGFKGSSENEPVQLDRFFDV